MAIEIRELVIKATVRKQFGDEKSVTVTQRDLQKYKKQILLECRDMIRDLIEENRIGR